MWVCVYTHTCVWTPKIHHGEERPSFLHLATQRSNSKFQLHLGKCLCHLFLVSHCHQKSIRCPIVQFQFLCLLCPVVSSGLKVTLVSLGYAGKAGVLSCLASCAALRHQQTSPGKGWQWRGTPRASNLAAPWPCGGTGGGSEGVDWSGPRPILGESGPPQTCLGMDQMAPGATMPQFPWHKQARSCHSKRGAHSLFQTVDEEGATTDGGV